ncbi:MAG: hypothetical protein ACOCUD_01345 [Bacillota bacterium]
MKKNRLKKSIFLLIIALFFLVSVTYSWVNYVLNLPPGSASLGGIEYSFEGGFIEANDPIYPGKNLVTEDFAINNTSSIATELRVKISYTKIVDTVVNDDIIYSADELDHLIVDFAIPFVYGDDDFWYYSDATTIFPTGVVTIFDMVTYDGNFVSNNYSEANINISILIQIKQANNVTWQDLTTFDFNTGHPAE